MMGARACSLAVLLFASVWADEVIVRLETTMADCDDCELIVLSRARHLGDVFDVLRRTRARGSLLRRRC